MKILLVLLLLISPVLAQEDVAQTIAAVPAEVVNYRPCRIIKEWFPAFDIQVRLCEVDAAGFVEGGRVKQGGQWTGDEARTIMRQLNKANLSTKSEIR